MMNPPYNHITPNYDDMSDPQGYPEQLAAALAASETRLNLLLNASPATIYSCQPDGDFACNFITHNIEALLGYTPAEFRAEPDFWLQRLHPDDRARVFSEIEIFFKTDILKHEYRLRHRDGHYVWIHDELTLLRDREGHPIEVVGFITDITDRKRGEIALQNLSDRLSLALEAGAFGIWDWDLIHDALWDGRMYEIYGLQDLGRAVTYTDWRNCVHPEDLEGAEERLRAAARGEAPFNIEFRIIHPNGEQRWIKAIAQVIRDDQGDPARMVGVNYDITEHKRAELALTAYAQQVEDLYNHAPCGYCSLDRDGRITQINHTALRWLDSARERVLGQFITQFMTADSQSVFAEHREWLAQSDTVQGLNYEITLLARDDEPMAVMFSDETQMGADGAIVGSRITITDMRQRIKAEKRLQQQLTQANLLEQITTKIRQSLDLETIFRTACDEVRLVLQADRVAIFQFYPEANYDDGEFIAESMVGDYASAVTVPVHDHCFGDNFADLYAHGRYYAVADIEAADLSDCHRDILRRFQVRANLVVPLVEGKNALWGLVCIHQCRGPRVWLSPEIELAQQIANQLAIAIHQASLYERLQGELGVRQQAEAQILHQLEQQRTLARLIENVRQSLAVDEILATVAPQVRALLQCDRVIMFRLYADGRSRIVEEAVSPEFPRLKDMQWEDEVWSEEILECYWRGQPRIVPDVMQDIWTDCLIPYSRAGQIQSKIVAPILQEAHTGERHRWVIPGQGHRKEHRQKLWGIIVAHACGQRRVWQEQEAELLQQVANSVAIAIQQASLFEQLQQELGDRQLAEQELAERNQQLSLSNQELARATRLKDEFLANMSHELRTPLNAILGITEALQEEVFGIVNERQIKAFQTIEDSGTHLLALINDILNLAKIASGEVTLEYGFVAVEQLCSSSLAFLKQQALKKRIRLVTQIPPGLPDLYVDEIRLRQVLLNLLTNAVKFTEEGGTVTLEVSLVSPGSPLSAPAGIRFSVTDTGIGIAPKNLDKLFRPFVQIDGALNRKQMGTGLGLALVKQIVELHGGRVGLTSTLGMGSCFTIDLPYTSAVAMSVPGETIAPEISSSLRTGAADTSRLILLAEDNPANVMSVACYLEAQGYRLIYAHDGQGAIDLTLLHQPDLILMDIQMPGMDGLEAIQRIRQQETIAPIPIIALTALSMKGDRERCLAAGADEYLSKPVRLKQLNAVIQALLDVPTG